ncbi:MAG: response regulator transcription factor [Planctomycetia bacterium]|nr:response regulator transcription factor [Planctomycetia bacterium]
MFTPPTDAVVYVVEDDAAIRDALSRLIAQMGLVVRAFANATSFLEALDGEKHGCIILDLRLPDMDGMEVYEQIVARGAALPVIVITGHGDVATGVEAIKRGVMDFLEKPFQPDKIRNCIQAALAADLKRRHAAKRVADDLLRVASLSADELRVAKALAAGRPVKEIAAALKVSVRTVHSRRKAALQKLGVPGRARLVEFLTRFQLAGGVLPGGDDGGA